MLNQIGLKKYTNVFIVDNRHSWSNCVSLFNSSTDIVFCLDFGLKNELANNGYKAFFLDHIVEPSILQEANYQMHHFLDNWYKSEDGKDLLLYKDLKLGDALLLNLITDITSFCHFFFNAIAIKTLNYEVLILSIQDKLVHDVFKKLNFVYKDISTPFIKSDIPIYTFPISFWVNSKLYKKSIIQKISGLLKFILSIFHYLLDLVSKPKYNIYIQDYHPTHQIIAKLLSLKNFVVRTSDYSWKLPIFKQRRIPKSISVKKVTEITCLLETFILDKKQVWHYNDYNLSEYLYEIITPIVAHNLLELCNKSDLIINHFEKKNYSLIIPVTNYWVENRLIMNYAKNKNISIFMIANGLLNLSFEKDARDSNYVNCYAVSVKEDYFKNSENVFCLGDPRMDKYYFLPPKQINRDNPVIIIGAAGFNPIDLNSYLAYEFDFLYDILKVLTILRNNGFKNKIILKVRDNGFSYQYQNFVNEYFFDLNVEIIQSIPFSTLILQADLYISIYSQTIIEASCINVPVLYYKKDSQFINRPFDGNSELVTASDIEELKEKIYLFYNESNVYDKFMDKSVLEKYIGPLDGENTKRNVDFILSIVEKSANDNVFNI